MNSSIALGFFDGVHTAHQKIIEAAVKKAEEENLTPIVLTFDRMPKNVLLGKKIKQLTTTEEKRSIVEKMGARLCTLCATDEIFSMTAEAFAQKILKEKFGAKHVFCGYNYRFGFGGEGDGNVLSLLGEKYGFTAKTIPCLTDGGSEISSERIRALIKSGDVSTAKRLLGRPYFITGEVTAGKRLGQSIGFPTANIAVQDEKIVPQNGVYTAKAVIGSEKYQAVTNVGTNPTVGTEALRTETYIINYNKNLYGKIITVEFEDFIRKEIKFNSLEELKSQIKKDIEYENRQLF